MESNKNETSEHFDKKTPNIKVGVKRKSPKLFFGILTFALLLIGGIVGLYLTKINQDLRQQADTGAYSDGECTQCLNGKCVAWDPTKPYPGDESCEKDNPKPTTDPGEPTEKPPKPTTDPGEPTPTGSVALSGYCESCSGSLPPSTPNSRCEADLTCAYEEPGMPGAPGLCVKSGETVAACQPTPTTDPGDPTPTTDPADPTPTSPIGPQCRDIRMYDITNGESSIMSEDDDESLVPGESTVRFVCSSSEETNLPEDYFYAFRVYEPCGSDYHLTPLEFINENGENGINYGINMPGDFMAQCAVCTEDSVGDIVCDWESLIPTICE